MRPLPSSRPSAASTALLVLPGSFATPLTGLEQQECIALHRASHIPFEGRGITSTPR